MKQPTPSATETLGARLVSYRMSVSTESGPSLIEQVAYSTEKDDQITHLRLVCSGFRSV